MAAHYAACPLFAVSEARPSPPQLGSCLEGNGSALLFPGSAMALEPRYQTLPTDPYGVYMHMTLLLKSYGGIPLVTVIPSFEIGRSQRCPSTAKRRYA